MESLSLLTSGLVILVATIAIIRGIDVRLVLLVAAGAIGIIAGDLRPILRVFLETFSNEKYVVPLCTAMGFAYVLKHTGCDTQLVNLLIGPVRRFRFLLVPGVILTGFIVNIPVVSQSSTAVCLGTVVVPVMRSANFSPLTIGACLLLGASVGGELLNPSAVELAAVNDKTKTDKSILSWEYIPPLLFPLLIIALSITWWRAAQSQTTDTFPPGVGDSERIHYLQAAVPLLPLVLLFLTGPPLSLLPIPADWFAITTPDLPRPDRVTDSRRIGFAMLLGVLAAVLAAPRKAGGCMKAFFDGAGYGFANVVSLIVVANGFAMSLEQIGLAKLLGGWIHANPTSLSPLAAVLPCVFAIVCGSGIASSSAMYPTFHKAASQVGADADGIGALVSVGSAVGRTLSPVSAVALMCATLAGVKATDLTRRLALPLIVGLVTTVSLQLLGLWTGLRNAMVWFTESLGTVTLNDEQLAEMPKYYILTVFIETTVLFFTLSRRHSWRIKVFSGFWLTACTYPILWFVLPPLFDNYRLYLLVGELLVAILECALFWVVFIRGRSQPRSAITRDFAAIVLANLTSFGFGLILNSHG